MQFTVDAQELYVPPLFHAPSIVLVYAVYSGCSKNCMSPPLPCTLNCILVYAVYRGLSKNCMSRPLYHSQLYTRICSLQWMLKKLYVPSSIPSSIVQYTRIYCLQWTLKKLYVPSSIPSSIVYSYMQFTVNAQKTVCPILKRTVEYATL